MAKKFLDEDEAWAVYTALVATNDASLDPETFHLTLDLQDEARELLADVLGVEAE